jgi:hypothetical protein
MPRSALRPGTEPGESDCCDTVPDPPFALERLQAIGTERLVYHLPKPEPDGRTPLTLTPLELIDRLAALIPPP